MNYHRAAAEQPLSRDRIERGLSKIRSNQTRWILNWLLNFDRQVAEIQTPWFLHPTDTYECYLNNLILMYIYLSFWYLYNKQQYFKDLPDAVATLAFEWEVAGSISNTDHFGILLFLNRLRGLTTACEWNNILLLFMYEIIKTVLKY